MLPSSRKFNHAIRFLFAGLLFATAPVWALNKKVTVSAVNGRGDFTSIQAAINSCDPLQDICTINLLDVNYVLKAPIWIENKANITIQGATSSGGKPSLTFDPSLYTSVANPNTTPQAQQATVIKLFTLSWAEISGTADPMRPNGWLMWPFVGEPDGSTVNGPKGASTDASDSFSTSGFQHNGMIVVKKSQDIAIRGLRLTSQPKVFQNTKVWNQKYDIVFGTVGINLMQSLRVVVDNNDISGFFSGMYINGRNPGGMFGNANPSDINRSTIVPLSRYGQVGNHNIQRNYFHDNWWCFYGESMWDLSNRIHHNVTYNNMNKSFQYADSIKVANATTDEMNNQTGGFYYMKDQVLAADRIYNNTIFRSPIVLGFGGWRGGSQELVYNNVIRLTKEIAQVNPSTDWHQLMQNYGHTVWDNTFQMTPVVGVQKKTIIDNLTIKDTGLVGVYAPNSNCGGGCNMSATYPYVSQIQPMFVWNGWGVKQYLQDSIAGERLIFNGNPITGIAAISGYAGKKYAISTTNGYGPWGVINQMSVTPRIMDSIACAPRKNYFAFYLPTALDTVKPLDTSFTKATPTDLFKLAPLWDSLTNKATILRKAWNNDNTGNTDGTPGNRGAFCYDSITNKTTLGCSPSGVVLSLVDQQITSLQGTAVQIPMLVSQVDGQTGAEVAAAFTGYTVDSVYYYHGFPWGYLDSAYQADASGNTSKLPYVMPTKITTTTWPGTSGSMLKFNVGAPLGAQEDVVRFEVFMSALDPATGKRVSVIGIYFYRKMSNSLQVQFCSDSLCTKVITDARVGDKVYMQAKVLNASGVYQPAQLISSVFGNPSIGSSARNLLTGNYINSTSQLLATFTGSFSMPVTFEAKGSQSVSITGLVGAATSAQSILGSGSINIRPGLPYQVQFLNPQTYQVKKCNGNPSDTSYGCNELQGVVPNQGTLVVYDKFGNTVDTAATVQLNIDPTAYLGSIASHAPAAGTSTKIGATAATATGGTATVQTDATGNATFTVMGDPAGVSFPWVQMTGVVSGVAGAPIDTAIARLMPPAGHLAWQSPARVDTFVLTAIPVTIFLTKNGTSADVSNPNANAKVGLSAAQSSYIKFYSDAAMTTPIDSVQLVGSVATVYVAGTKPTGQDSLIGTIAGFSATPGMPAKFRNPPQPPTPRLKSAVFLDNTCDSLADVVVVTFDPTGTPATLDTSKVKVNGATITVGTQTITLDPTQMSLIGGGTSVSFPIPLASQTKLAPNSPAGTISLTAALNRSPAPDTMVAMGSVAVTDGIGPRPVLSAIVENSATGTAPDTLKVQFSEPVNYTGTTFPFLVFGSNGTTPIATTGFAVSSVTGSGTKTLTFVVTGNTGSLAEGDVLAIKSGSGLSDLAGNDGRYTQCGNDTTHLQLQPVAVPIDKAWISDANGDGIADQITVVFRRDFRTATEAPNSLVVSDWKGVPSTTLPWTTAVAAGAATYTLPLSGAPSGGTVGTKADGTGTLTLIQGALRNEAYTLLDSVAPIATGKAKLTLGTAATGDKLVVTFSEPVTQATGTVWMMRQRDAASLAFTSPTKNVDGTVWTFTVPSGVVLVGDSIRMALAQSALKAVSGSQVPAASGLAPYIPVVGGDPAPDSAIVLDLNGDGTADAVRVVYHNPLFGNPTFSFVWNGATISLDSNGYGKSLKGTLTGTLPVTGFPAGVTSGNGTGTSTSLVDGAASDPLPFVLVDGVAPVVDSVYVKFASDDGLPDTILVKVSESVVNPSVATLLAFSPSPIILTQSSPLIVVDPTHYMLLTAPGSTIPGFGDSARLADGDKDALGNTVTSNSRKVPVLTGPHPVKYHAGVYPVAVQTQSGPVDPTVAALPDVTVWIIPPAGSSYGSTLVRFDPATGTLSTGTSPSDRLDTAIADHNLIGIRVDISTSFDGQVLFYDNLGVFVGRSDLKVDIENLKVAGQNMVASNGKYSMFAAIHSSNDVGKQLASGVYMARLIGYSEQVVNGQKLRIMIQNKLFKFGHYRSLK